MQKKVNNRNKSESFFSVSSFLHCRETDDELHKFFKISLLSLRRKTGEFRSNKGGEGKDPPPS